MASGIRPSTHYAPPMNEYAPEDFGIGRLFQQVRDAVIVADSSSERILLWNRGATELFGYTSEEALSMPLHMLVAPELIPRHRAGLARYAETGKGELVDSSEPVEVRAIKKDGSEVFVELTLTSIEVSSRDGGRTVLALIRDSTHRREAARLKEAELQHHAALEIHDTIIQGIVVAKAFLELGEHDRADEALTKTLNSARALVGQLLEEREAIFGLSAGDFVRSTPASLEHGEA